ncbi:hypothetical protein [Alienimonas californiensis]|uniref:HEAT repeat domain-containing protein n=1 Tax=Alienimonas californiensis TaxID=2527989 RepID=A0A517P9Q3_9PLAN|nr:hypothetical protein [Alienimonas californiensis]QDT16107.1 hypothetical protein CA12_22050 [Alienimonas californiensis]
MAGLAAGVGPAFAGFEEDLAAVVTVGPKGEGSVEAAEALRRLSDAPADRLPALFAAFADAGPVGRNLLAGAVQAIADDLPPAELAPALIALLTVENPHPEAAALAFGLLRERAPEAADRYLADRGLGSAAPPVRRAAVAAALAKLGENPEPAGLRNLLDAALDRDQVETLAKRLADAGEPVDLKRQFGFLTNWQLVGPFDHRDGVGWDRTLPPEETPGRFDPDATFPSKHPEAGGTVTWQPLTTDEDFGRLDIAGDLTNWKGSAVMLAREYQAPVAGPVTFRLGTPNAFKLYLNGELVFARAEYHRGTKMDQYVIPAEVRAGRNLLMVKLLQNEQDQSWAQSYQMQFRVTDPTGAALREPQPAAAE